MKASNCCGASIIEETDLCSQCKEHCEVLEATDFETWADRWVFEMSAEEEAKLREEYERIQNDN